MSKEQIAKKDFIERLSLWMKAHPGQPVSVVCAVVSPVNDGSGDILSKARVYTYMVGATDLLAGAISLIEAGQKVHAENTCPCETCADLGRKLKAGLAALGGAAEEDGIGIPRGNA